MSASNVRKGKEAERQARRHAQQAFDAAGVDTTISRRAALGLPEDEGDLFGIPGVALQVKNTQKLDLTVVDQAEQQAAVAGVPYGWLLQKRRQHPPGRWYAVGTFDTLLATIIELEQARRQ